MMLYLIMIGPAILFSLWATIKVKSTFKRYSTIGSASGITGAQAARIILDRNGLMNVSIEESHGMLSDHYDPRGKVLRLSRDVYHSPSLSAIGVASHEAGHALQDAENYGALSLRQAMIPISMFGSNLSWILLILGMILNMFSLVTLGIFLFSLAVLVSIITLPVEFNATARAKMLMTNYGILTMEEQKGASRVLDAAAMTYVAAALTAILQLLYYLLIFGFLGGDD